MQMINLQTMGIKTLSDLTSVVSPENVDTVLNINNIPRTPNIAQAYQQVCDDIVSQSTEPISPNTKLDMLGKYTDNADIFETVALADEQDWQILYQNGSLHNFIRLPDEITLPLTNGVIGNGQTLPRSIYDKIAQELRIAQTLPNYDPLPKSMIERLFADYNSNNLSSRFDEVASKYTNPDVFYWFHIPWGEVTLYSSIDKTSVDFPVYPEELQDGRSANYDTMPELLYQYEPWQVYKSSGPRKVSYKFDFHRDMWTGNHLDGKAGQLVRFCEACCYPDYDGSAVHTPTVDLYIGGKRHISGVLTECNADWDGPLGLDNYYLHCVLTISIIEVSPIPLNYKSVKSLPIVGYDKQGQVL